MICRIATKKDILPLCAFLDKVWRQLELPYTALVKTYYALDFGESPTGNRMAILEDEGIIVAALGSKPVKTDLGLGFVLTHTVADQDRPDKTDLLDRIVLWSGRLAIMEGRPIITASNKMRAYMFGRDLLGMEHADGGTNAKTGKVETIEYPPQPIAPILDGILKRHPGW